jgi:hypothetical protein
MDILRILSVLATTLVFRVGLNRAVVGHDSRYATSFIRPEPSFPLCAKITARQPYTASIQRGTNVIRRRTGQSEAQATPVSPSQKVNQRRPDGCAVDRAVDFCVCAIRCENRYPSRPHVVVARMARSEPASFLRQNSIVRRRPSFKLTLASHPSTDFAFVESP